MAHPQSRGERIAQKNRVKSKRAKYTNKRHHGYEHVPACSCWMCGNDRAQEGITLQERKALIDYLESVLEQEGLLPEPEYTIREIDLWGTQS